MGWEHEIAQRIKDSGKMAKEKAVEEASAYIGTIISLSPLKITAMEGSATYEGNEIIQSRTFRHYQESVKKVGAEVIIFPVGDVNTIAVIDIVGG